MEINDLSSQIIKAAIHVHKELGPGGLIEVVGKWDKSHMGGTA